MKRRFNLTTRAALLLLGIVTARYANDRAVENALIAYPPRIECSKLLKRCQSSFFTEAIRAANHVIVTGCTVGGDRSVLVAEEDGSIFVPLGAEGYIDLPNARTVYARLMPTLVTGLTGPLFDINGYLVAKDQAAYAPFASTVWPEAVSLQVDGVATVETQRLIPIIGWLSLAIAATVAASIYLIRSRRSSSAAGNSLGLPELALKDILPAAGPRLLLLGTAPYWRGILSILNRTFPVMFALVAFSSPFILNYTFESDVTQLLRYFTALLWGAMIFFVSKRILADSLTREGRGVCWLFIGLSALLMSHDLPVLLSHWRELQQSGIQVSLSLSWTLALYGSIALYGILGVTLRSWRIRGLNTRLNLLPDVRRRPRGAHRNLYRKVLLNLQLATYYVIPIAVAFVKTVVGVLAYGALSHRRNRLRWKIRRYDAPPAKQVLDSDLRPPFVLLRSFVDDSLEVKGQTVDQFTFEEVLTRQLSRLGPVIAIGRPGEKLPQSGAAREYLADDVWQNRVSELLEQAQCVVFIIHKTEGLRWEVARITELGGRKKTLFIIPPVNHAEVTKRWHGLMDGDKPSQQVSLALPKKTLVVFLPAPGFEVAIRGIRNESTVDDYDLAIWLGAKLIDTWANARVE